MTEVKTNKAPYLVTWKQILLSIFTLGIWNFAWTNRIMFFMTKLRDEKNDTETKTLLNMIVPFYAIFWSIKLSNGINESGKGGKARVSKGLFVTLQAIACAVAFGLLCGIIATVSVIFSVEEAGLGLVLVLLVLAIIFVPSMIQLPLLALAQIAINDLAWEHGIANEAPYSARTVGSPYCSVARFVLLNIFTLGLWLCIGWVSKVTAFLNRVCEEKRDKGEETLLCFFVPGYLLYWIVKTAKLVDSFSSKKENPVRITEKCKKTVVPAFYALVAAYAIALFTVVAGVASGAALVWTIGMIIAGVALITEIVFLWICFLAIQRELNNDVYLRNVESEGILEIRNLRKCFPLKKTMFGTVTKELTAVNNVSFVLKQGETLGIVGESGCGKTTMGRTILKLYPSEEGEIIFNGQDITFCPDFQTRKIRTDMQIIFQDPYSSLPPRSTVGAILAEPVKVHGIVPDSEVKSYVLDLMDKCGLRDYYYERYPHEFSGGQRQRICIARALSVKPKLVICDEPVSALDVSIQAQVINLLKDLQKSMGLTYLFISHDLSVVKFISDKIGVMYLGVMVEFGNKKEIFDNPLHPYTKALFSAIPNPNPDEKMQRITLTGDIPSPANPPKGCCFHTRCPHAMEICKHVQPCYREYEPGHFAACHLLNQEDNK